MTLYFSLPMGVQPPMPTPTTTMTKEEAGAYFKSLRRKKSLRLQDVVDATTIPNAQYLSALEGGRYNILNSEHFPSLVKFFDLSAEEVEAMRPGTLVTVTHIRPKEEFSPPSSALSAAAHYPDFEEEEEPIEDALAEAVRLYGDLPDFEGLTDPVMQRALQGIDFRQRPQTPQEWLAKFLKYRDDLRSSDA